MDKSGAAFPGIAGRDLANWVETWNLGLTKRELFAALAMAGILAHSNWQAEPVPGAAAAVGYADALLAELAKGEGA